MLHDIDKTGNGRPKVNSHDTIGVPLVAHGTNSTNYATGASGLDQLLGGKNGQFTIVDSGVWDGSTTSVTTGNPGAGKYLSGGQTVATINHNLGVIPAALAYYEVATSPLEYDLLPSTALAAIPTPFWWTLSLLQDNTNLYIQLSWMVYGAAITINLNPVRWYLLEQVAN